jgi:hypothetical protein
MGVYGLVRSSGFFLYGRWPVAQVSERCPVLRQSQYLSFVPVSSGGVSRLPRTALRFGDGGIKSSPRWEFDVQYDLAAEGRRKNRLAADFPLYEGKRIEYKKITVLCDDAYTPKPTETRREIVGSVAKGD